MAIIAILLYRISLKNSLRVVWDETLTARIYLHLAATLTDTS